MTTTTTTTTIVEALHDPELFGKVFPDLTTWQPWVVFLSALFGLPMSKDQLAFFSHHTARAKAPHAPAREAWLPTGRRGGKSRIAALVSVYLAVFRDYSRVLSPGENGVVQVIAQDRRQARVIFSYVTALLEAVPMLASMVVDRQKEAIHLNNGISIEIATANFRAVRGFTIVAAVCDEIAFWRSEDSANPDKEILDGIRPGMSTIPGALLLCISSPYARRGVLWEAYQKHWGKDGDILVWQADTQSMNPTVDKRVIEEAYEADPAAAAAEYGAEFRRDLEAFVGQEVVSACVVPNRLELPPLPDTATLVSLMRRAVPGRTR